MATQKGYSVLKRVVSSYRDIIGAVVSFHETGVEKDWFDDIGNECVRSDIIFNDWKDVRNDFTAWVRKEAFTGMIVISWRYLIPLSVNDVLEDRMIVFHDSLLPKYRGFAPVVTAMINGEDKVGVSAIFAEDEVDAGDIIEQKSMPLDEDIYIKEVIDRISVLYEDLCMDILDKMQKGCLEGKAQSAEEATFSIWRDEEDYRIDWDKDAGYIYTFIRAVGDPYKGAFTCMDGKNIRIRKAEVPDEDPDFAIRDTGKFWRLDKGCPLVVCGRGLLKIIEATDEEGNIIVFNKLRTRLK